MSHLELADVEQIVRLLAEAGDPTVEISVPDRKRLLLEGVAQLVQADIWTWLAVTNNPAVRGEGMGTSYIDGGWKSDQERAKFYGLLSEPISYPLQAPAADACLNEKHTTYLAKEAVSDEIWQQLGDLWHSTGLDHGLISAYPLNNRVLSAVSLFRRLGAPAFTARDRAIVHVIVQQVDWLHRFGTDVPASSKVPQLSPREKQVLIFLLSGKSRKEIAHALSLSEHTVGDYMKQLHKHFAVNSRAELLSYFISGGQK
jgi:DNA-binding CsgD family transcriptional regulator